MRKSAFIFLLALGGAASAALPRVSVQAPLTPISGPAPAAVLVPVSAAPKALAVPVQALEAVPAPLPDAAPALLELPVPSETPAPRDDEAAAAGPKLIEALLENAPQAAGLAQGSLEDAAPALERNFRAAAALGVGGSGSGTTANNDGASAHHDLEQRFLSLVRLDDHGDPAQAAALARAVRRMLGSPTGRSLAEQFLAEGAPAVVRFETFEGSRLYEEGGRKTFYGPIALTDWRDGRVLVRINLNYLAADDRALEQELPSFLAHELLGHGLWYVRAVKAKLLPAYHHHELNEANARLVGWLVDYELDRRFEDPGAWNYLSDPAQYLSKLKLWLPFYALAFSSDELKRPVQALEARLEAARAKRKRLETELGNHRAWDRIIDHFIDGHGLPARRFAELRWTMADWKQRYKDDLANLDEIIAAVGRDLERMKAESDRRSEGYLRRAASQPLFVLLDIETRKATEKLKSLIKQSPAESPGKVGPTQAKSDQFTFDDLQDLYRKDKKKHPDHWNG